MSVASPREGAGQPSAGDVEMAEPVEPEYEVEDFRDSRAWGGDDGDAPSVGTADPEPEPVEDLEPGIWRGIGSDTAQQTVVKKG